MAEEDRAAYQAVVDYIQNDCQFAELAQLAAKVEGQDAAKVVAVTRNIFMIWLLEKLLAQPETSSRSVQEVLSQSMGELVSLSATDFSDYLVQGVFKGAWDLDDTTLAQKFAPAAGATSLQAKLNQAELKVIQLTDHQADVLQAHCEVLKAALVLIQKLGKVA